MAETVQETDDVKALASRCATWEAGELVRATTVEACTYGPESLAVLRQEIDRRGVTAIAPTPFAFSTLLSEHDQLLLNAAFAGLLLAVTFAVGGQVTAGSAGLLGNSLLWITYLWKSDRVRVTYRSPPPP
jgi:hypothetical protein